MEPYYVGAVVVASVLVASHYFGYLSAMCDWVSVRKQRVKLIINLLSKIQNDVSDPTKTTISFSVNESDVSASVLYERMGQQYLLLVPYNRSYVAAMTQFKAELLRSEKDSLIITQQPGIPYLVTAEELGGYAIRVTNEDTGLSKEYGKNIAPKYGEEVMDRE
ncbi:Hypothetical protein HVR_LOCUS1355 [uncultured virus]|nr:Hypothetical protein HVR_LOCUS1355 [uncultured virus]